MGQGPRHKVTKKLPFVKSYQDRHGKVRHYLRRPGAQSVAIPGDYGSKAFMEAYWAAMENAPKREPGVALETPGSFSALIALYYKTKSYTGLADITKATYRNVLERFRKEHGEKLVKGFKQRHAEALLDGLEANEVTYRKVLRLILKLALARGWIDVHPMAEMRRPKKAKVGFKAWSLDDVRKYLTHWPPGSRERLALLLLLFTAQRRADVRKLGRQHRQGDVFRIAQQKGGETTVLEIPIPDMLAAELDLVPATQMTYVQTQYGAPFSPGGFTTWFVEKAQAAGLPAGRTPHGLRKAAMYLTAEGEGTARELMALSGHKNLSEVTLYTEAADQKRLAVSAMKKLEGRTNLSNEPMPVRQLPRKV